MKSKISNEIDKLDKQEKPKKVKTPSFILELPLKVSRKNEKIILSQLESARKLYNASLGEAKRRMNLVRQSKTYQEAKKIPKASVDSLKPKDIKNRKLKKDLFAKAREAYDFNEYSLHKYVGELRHNLPNNLDIHTTQKLASRAFKAVEKILFGTAKKVRFKGFNQLNSVESKSNVAGIRWKNNKLEWGKLSLEAIIDEKDEVIFHGLSHRIKYSRLYRKVIKGKNRFYVQLVLQGKPLVKAKNRLGKGNVCYDLGPSTVAIVGDNGEVGEDRKIVNARLTQFCSELDPRIREIGNLQRKIDRQRRANNPDNYADGNGQGKIKKGRLTWKKSRYQIKNENKLKELHRALAAHRKSLQGKLANETIRMGNHFFTEKLSKKWLQKNFGKSIGLRAPGMFDSMVERKAESAGGSHTEIPTQPTKLSQNCVCGDSKKKKLSDRVQDCGCGVYCQRDLFSAYLALFVQVSQISGKGKDVKYILQAGQAKRLWSSADKLLRTAWRDAVESTSRGTCPSSFGRIDRQKAYQSYQSQSGSFAEKGITESKDQNAVVARLRGDESLEAGEVFPLEPTGF